MPRGRSSTFDDQRDTILARAAELFAARGYPGTSMNEVAAACGVSKPALYHYVRDKHELLVQICAAHIDRLLTLVEEVQAEPLDAEARLRALILRFVETYADAQHEHRVLTEDVKFLDPAAAERILDGERRVVAAFAAAVAAVRPDTAASALHKPLAMLLFGMINWMFTWLQPGGRYDHAAMAPVVADLFFGGIAAVRDPAAGAATAPPG
ncbi:MAG: hypothetical protein RJA44_2337 [Pseudomonadota bacterium]|jgi:TetR/AcrR family transcriptional regulator